MWSRRVSAVVLLVSLALLPLLGGTRARAEEPSSPWHDLAVVEKRFAEACDLVEELCGAKFRVRPSVRLSEKEDVRAIVGAELEPLKKVLGTDEAVEAALDIVAHALIGKYQPGAHVVHVLPGNAESIASALGRPPPNEEDLRVTLAHEATHALDFERFPLERRMHAATSLDEMQAVGAVVEGHAQLVAEQAAARWGLTAAFERYTSAITALPPDLPEEDRQTAKVLAAALGFNYVQGHAFLAAVWKARGREGVEAVLADPPRRSASIEHPELHLDPARTAGDPDLDDVIEAFRPLVADAAWTVAKAPLLAATMEPLRETLPEPLRTDFLRGYREGRILSAQVADEPVAVFALVGLFETAADAVRFVEIERATSARKDEEGGGPRLTILSSETKDGAGPSGRLAGYAAHKVVRVGTEEIGIDMQCFSVGRVAAELVVTNVPALDRAVQDRVVDRVAAWIVDPEAAEALEPPAVPPFERSGRTLILEVLDPEGKPVPRAHWAATADRRTRTGEVRDGRAEIRVRGATVDVAVWGAESADGAALPLAPSPARPAADPERIEIRLEPGVSIEGVVVDEGGKPAPGVRVEAHVGFDPDSGFPPGAVHGAATTGEDGSFRVVGLARTGYSLRLVRDRRPASTRAAEARGGDREVRVVLTPAVGARITVVDPAGEPVRGAEVQLASFGSGDPYVEEVRTNARGEAAFQGLERERTYRMTVKAPASREDLADLDSEGWTPHDDTVSLAAGWTLRGRVERPDGTPAEAWVHRKGEPSRTVRAGADGRFTIHGNAAGPVEVAATFPSDAQRPWGSDEEWTSVEPASGPVVLRLDPAKEPFELRVRVLDADGQPVPRARLRLEEEGRHTTHLREVHDGDAAIELPRGRYDVEVYGAADAAGARRDLAAARREDVEDAEVEIRLSPGRSLRGRVVDDHGRGVAGVRIDAVPEGRERPFFGPDPHAESASWATTAEDGSFELLGLDERRHTLRLDPPAPFAETESSGATAGTEALELTVRRAATLTVVDEADRPVHRAHVHVSVTRTTPTGSATTYQDLGTTDEQGRVVAREFDPAHHLTLRVRPPQAREDLAGHVVERWRPASETVRLGRGFTARGVVEDEDGPVRSAVVHWRVGRDVARWSDELLDRTDRTTDAAGRFVVRHLPRGPVRLQAQVLREGRWRETEEVSVDPDHPTATLRFAPGPRTVRIRLAGAAKGQKGMMKPAGAGLSVGPTVFFFESDGVALVEGLMPGAYSVWVPHVGAEGLVAWSPSVDVGKTEIVLEPERPVEVRFRLKVPEGAEVTSADVLGPLLVAVEAIEVDGVWVAAGLPPGRWRIHAKARTPGAWLYADQEAETGGEAVEVELKPR